MSKYERHEFMMMDVLFFCTDESARATFNIYNKNNA